ncbi:membrane-spanning 4-domains subfamily A member 15-like [Pituophis catenifer annectens]|uniref:membrane-spanning 4-domains subfamily A member 15-like n=1 Tax=Pituophis catenifer annectens TaxID=94852 RepID=UPI0039937CDA
MASGNTVVMPSKGANIQTPSGLPSVALQASGATPYPQLGTQQLGASTSVPQQVLQKNPLQDFLNAETKVFGAVQIMIGLLHIAFGAVVISLPPPGPGVTAIGGYPFWGGIFFISSGSLCITAANSQNRVLVKSSIGMNITSAIMALTGILIYFCDYIYLSTCLQDPEESIQSVGYGLSSVLLLFSLLEFCITVPLAHFGCQATCRSDAQPTVLFVPYQVIGGGEVTAEPNPPPPPPTYDNMVTKSQ